MKKQDLTRLIHRRLRLSPAGTPTLADIDRVLAAFGEQIVANLQEGVETTLPAVGRLTSKMSTPRRAKNLRTGAPMEIPSRLVVRLATFRSFRERLNAGHGREPTPTTAVRPAWETADAPAQ